MMKKQHFGKVMYLELKRMILKNTRIFICIVSIHLVYSLLLLSNTVFFKKFFEDMTFAVDHNLGIISPLKSFIVLCIIIISLDIINAVINHLLDTQRMKVKEKIMEDLFLKINTFNAIDFENPKILDAINKAKAGIDSSISVVIRTEVILSNYLVYFSMIFVYLFTLHPLLSMIIICIFIPTLISYSFRNKVKNTAEEKLAIQRRRMAAYETYIGDRKFFKETRHLKATHFFKNKLLESLKEFNSINLRAFNKINTVRLLLNFVNFLGFIFILGIMFYLTKIKAISVGEVGAVLITVTTIYDRMNELFNFQIADLSDSYTGLYNLHYMLEREIEEKNEMLMGADIKISIENVNFRYPNADRNTLDHISLEIKPKEIVAIVGENGSGKTTLSKLIAGLYKPSEGNITYNGISIDNINLKSLYKKVTIVFQNFQQYALNVIENVALSNINDVDFMKVNDKLKSVDLTQKIEKLDNGLDTMLSKEFGGTDLSVGQWQRLAIARANYKDSSLIVFDEPTASLDPLQEMDIMQKLINITQDRSTIIVTHRIGVARLADKIVTMKNGKIVEIGNHEELLKKQGEYASLYNSQKQWYE